MSDDSGPGIMVYAGLGMLNAICVLAGLGVGYLVDQALGTLPICMLIGLVAGITLGVTATRSEMRRRS